MATVGRLHRVSLTLTGVIAAASVMGGSTLTGVAGGVLIGGLIIGSGQLLDTERKKTRVRLVYALTILGLLWALLEVLSASRIDALLLVLMLGVFNRFLLRRGQRDDFLIAGAASALITAATTVTPGILFLPIILSFLPALLWALWTAMLLGAVEGENGAHPGPGAIKQMAEREAPPFAKSIAFGGVALMLIGFSVVSILPRYRFSRLFGAGYFMSLPGASDTMELRTSGAQTLDDSTVVLRVEPRSGVGSGMVSGLYARMYVLDRFDGKVFKSSSNGALFPVRLAADRLPEGADVPDFAERDSRATVKVTMNRTVRDNAFQPIVTLGRSAPSELLRRNVRQTISGAWTIGTFPGATLTYKVLLDRPLADAPLPEPIRSTVDTRLLELPDSLDPRVVALGQELTGGLEDTGKKVNAVVTYLSKGFIYSLSPLPGDSRDPLVKFLFEAKQGHCELYAGALAVLLRVAGVKTRVVTGYYNGTWNDIGGYLAFAQQDAHAWVEVYYEGEGWRWVDATPEDLRARHSTLALAYLRDWYGAAEAFWFDNVIDFDERKRSQIVHKLWAVLGEIVPGLGESEAETPDGSAGRRRFSSGTFAVGLALLIPLFVAGLALRRRRNRSPESLGARLRVVLGAKGDENRTLGTLIARAPQRLRSQASTCVGLYEALRFGPGSEAPDPDRVMSAVRALERSLKAARRISRGTRRSDKPV